jgi:hypothetical protein
MNVQKNKDAHRPDFTTINVVVIKEPFQIVYGIFKYAQDKTVDITPIVSDTDIKDIKALMEEEDAFINATVDINLTDFVDVQNTLLFELAKSLSSVRNYATKLETDKV